MKSVKSVKIIAPVLFTFLVIGVFWYTKITAIKFYPPLMNFIFFAVFFASIFAKETVIQKIARLTDGRLEEPITTYTKKLTYVWIVFLFINFFISVVTVFLSDEMWMLYNGVVSYLLVGTLFISEYIFRIYFKRKHNL